MRLGSFAGELKSLWRNWESQISVLDSSRMATLQSPGSDTGAWTVERPSQ